VQKTKAHLMIVGAKIYFETTVLGKLKNDLLIYEICRFVNPVYWKKLEHSGTEGFRKFKDRFGELVRTLISISALPMNKLMR
jgi:hypothetical protein